MHNIEQITKKDEYIFTLDANISNDHDDAISYHFKEHKITIYIAERFIDHGISRFVGFIYRSHLNNLFTGQKAPNDSTSFDRNIIELG